LSPFNAWILSKSLETLPVRMDRHCSNAFALAVLHLPTTLNLQSRTSLLVGFVIRHGPGLMISSGSKRITNPQLYPSGLQIRKSRRAEVIGFSLLSKFDQVSSNRAR
ncbi:MAG: hypothetical protein ACO1NZ_08760, partial [Adhaeribacter sp.]